MREIAERRRRDGVDLRDREIEIVTDTVRRARHIAPSAAGAA